MAVELKDLPKDNMFYKLVYILISLQGDRVSIFLAVMKWHTSGHTHKVEIYILMIGCVDCRARPPPLAMYAFPLLEYYLLCNYLMKPWLPSEHFISFNWDSERPSKSFFLVLWCWWWCLEWTTPFGLHFHLVTNSHVFLLAHFVRDKSKHTEESWHV